jgi:hypothetical protein
MLSDLIVVALETRGVRALLKEGKGVYLTTTEPCSLTESDLRRVAELAFQADSVPLLDAVYRLEQGPAALADVHIWSAFAYIATACAVWYTRTVGVTVDMLLDPRCDLEYALHVSSLPLVLAHTYGKVSTFDLMDICLKQCWIGWIPVVQALGGEYSTRHVYMLDRVCTTDIKEVLRLGLYDALVSTGTKEDWKKLAEMFYTQRG